MVGSQSARAVVDAGTEAGAIVTYFGAVAAGRSASCEIGLASREIDAPAEAFVPDEAFDRDDGGVAAMLAHPTSAACPAEVWFRN